MIAKRFEELTIWQSARVLVKEIYLLYSVDSIAANDFGFKNQMTRAAVSVMNNIAEGFERHSNADFARFLDMAKASSGEVRSMLYAAEDLLYISPEGARALRGEYEILSKGIASLTKHIRR